MNSIELVREMDGTETAILTIGGRENWMTLRELCDLWTEIGTTFIQRTFPNGPDGETLRIAEQHPEYITEEQ